MKNMRKVLAVILALTIVLSVSVSFTASAATYTDVQNDATYSEGVKILSALSILTGYTDGTFKPEGNNERCR